MAYGARLESVLGASPRGFESPILRELKTALDQVFYDLDRERIPLHVLRYVLSLIQMLGEAVYCRFLHRRGDVAVDIHGRGDRGVPEALLHYLGVLAEFEQ